MYTYNNNYYTATMNDTTERAALSGNVQADVCVIGAGLAGLSTAWELVSRGKTVVLLEAGRVAWGPPAVTVASSFRAGPKVCHPSSGAAEKRQPPPCSNCRSKVSTLFAT